MQKKINKLSEIFELVPSQFLRRWSDEFAQPPSALDRLWQQLKAARLAIVEFHTEPSGQVSYRLRWSSAGHELTSTGQVTLDAGSPGTISLEGLPPEIQPICLLQGTGIWTDLDLSHAETLPGEEVRTVSIESPGRRTFPSERENAAVPSLAGDSEYTLAADSESDDEDWPDDLAWLGSEATMEVVLQPDPDESTNEVTVAAPTAKVHWDCKWTDSKQLNITLRGVPQHKAVIPLTLTLRYEDDDGNNQEIHRHTRLTHHEDCWSARVKIDDLPERRPEVKLFVQTITEKQLKEALPDEFAAHLADLKLNTFVGEIDHSNKFKACGPVVSAKVTIKNSDQCLLKYLQPKIDDLREREGDVEVPEDNTADAGQNSTDADSTAENPSQKEQEASEQKEKKHRLWMVLIAIWDAIQVWIAKAIREPLEEFEKTNRKAVAKNPTLLENEKQRLTDLFVAVFKFQLEQHLDRCFEILQDTDPEKGGVVGVVRYLTKIVNKEWERCLNSQGNTKRDTNAAKRGIKTQRWTPADDGDENSQAEDHEPDEPMAPFNNPDAEPVDNLRQQRQAYAAEMKIRIGEPPELVCWKIKHQLQPDDSTADSTQKAKLSDRQVAETYREKYGKAIKGDQVTDWVAKVEKAFFDWLIRTNLKTLNLLDAADLKRLDERSTGKARALKNAAASDKRINCLKALAGLHADKKLDKVDVDFAESWLLRGDHDQQLSADFGLDLVKVEALKQKIGVMVHAKLLLHSEWLSSPVIELDKPTKELLQDWLIDRRSLDDAVVCWKSRRMERWFDSSWKEANLTGAAKTAVLADWQSAVMGCSNPSGTAVAAGSLEPQIVAILSEELPNFDAATSSAVKLAAQANQQRLLECLADLQTKWAAKPSLVPEACRNWPL